MTGKDITVILSQNGQALASTRIKSHEIEASCPTIEVASSTQQDWEELERLKEQLRKLMEKL